MRLSPRRVLRRLLGRGGAEQAWASRRNVEYDKMTVEIIRRTLTAGSNTVDAGAHRGEILRHLIDAAPDGHHNAFEPIPEFAQQLSRRFPTATVHQVALSDVEGEATFRFMPDRPAESSLYERTDREAGHQVVPITVPVRTLDAVLPSDEPIDFMKIDVEGAEVPLLRGATRTLSRSRPVLVVECHVDRLSDVIAVLETVGLEVFLMEDFLAGRHRTPDALTEFAVDNGEFFFAAAAP